MQKRVEPLFERIAVCHDAVLRIGADAPFRRQTGW